MLELQKAFHTAGTNLQLGAYSLTYVECFKNCNISPEQNGGVFYISNSGDNNYVIMTAHGAVYYYTIQQILQMINNYNAFIDSAPWFKRKITASQDPQRLEQFVSTTNNTKKKTSALESTIKSLVVQVEHLKQEKEAQAKQLISVQQAIMTRNQQIEELTKQNAELNEVTINDKILKDKKQLETALGNAYAENKILASKLKEKNIECQQLRTERNKANVSNQESQLEKLNSELRKELYQMALRYESRILELDSSLNKTKQDNSIKTKSLKNISNICNNLKQLIKIQNDRLNLFK